MAITCKQVSKILIKRFPEFEVFGKKEVNDFYDDEVKLDDTFSSDINAFVYFIAIFLEHENHDTNPDVDKMFLTIEECMKNGDSDVSHDTTVNCVEILINLSNNDHFQGDVLKGKFGQECISFWKNYDEAFGSS